MVGRHCHDALRGVITNLFSFWAELERSRHKAVVSFVIIGWTTNDSIRSKRGAIKTLRMAWEKRDRKYMCSGDALARLRKRDVCSPPAQCISAQSDGSESKVVRQCR